MDSASDFGSEGCRFESYVDRSFAFFVPIFLLRKVRKKLVEKKRRLAPEHFLLLFAKTFVVLTHTFSSLRSMSDISDAVIQSSSEPEQQPPATDEDAEETERHNNLADLGVDEIRHACKLQCF